MLIAVFGEANMSEFDNQGFVDKSTITESNWMDELSQLKK